MPNSTAIASIYSMLRMPGLLMAMRPIRFDAYRPYAEAAVIKSAIPIFVKTPTM